MKMEPRIAKRILRNVLVSLLMYALPIFLMLLTLYFTGDRPWNKNSGHTLKSTINKLINQYHYDQVF